MVTGPLDLQLMVKPVTCLESMPKAFKTGNPNALTDSIFIDMSNPLLSSVGSLVSQLGPDVLPVVGAEVAAGDHTIGGMFNRYATTNRHRTLKGFPLVHRRSRNSNTSRESGQTAHGLYSETNA